MTTTSLIEEAKPVKRIRKQQLFYLNPETYEIVKWSALRLNLSMTALIQLSVNHYLQEIEKEKASIHHGHTGVVVEVESVPDSYYGE